MKLTKFIRFCKVYGIKRTTFKSLGRLGYSIPLVINFPKRCKFIGIVGCGQYGLTTIGYFLTKNFGAVIRCTYDIEHKKGVRAKKVLCADYAAIDFSEMLNDPLVSTIYIASYHSAHVEQTVQALEAGKTVYCEKPIATDFSQLAELYSTWCKWPEKLSFGYNRPFSSAVKIVQDMRLGECEALTLSCFVQGHQLALDNWYRKPNEGTRICGNAGHWIDLFFHIIFSNLDVKSVITIVLTPCSTNDADDNYILNLVIDEKYLFNLVFTTLNEPFEGINEQIYIQTRDCSVEIDDFRGIAILKGNKKTKRRFFPKDPGHQASILQPFKMSEIVRNNNEVFLSSYLVLLIAELTKNGEKFAVLELSEIQKFFGTNQILEKQNELK